jgi:putative tricarboxylic transport membrane protein
MKWYDVYGGILWLLFGVIVGGVSLMDLGLGSSSHPGPGLFPFLIGIIMALVAVVLIAMALASRKKDATFNERPSFSRNIPLTLAVLCVYALVLEYLGYLISTSILLLYLFKIASSINWRMSLLMAVVVMAVSYYFFVVLLQSQLPNGILESVIR